MEWKVLKESNLCNVVVFWRITFETSGNLETPTIGAMSSDELAIFERFALALDNISIEFSDWLTYLGSILL